MFNLSSILGLLKVVGAATAALPEFRKVYDEIITTFDKTDDQVTLKEAYYDLISDNDAGHKRLQEKLAKAQG